MTNERQLEREEENLNGLRDLEIEAVRSKVPPPGTVGPEFCDQCDEDMPEGRRELGYRICVECATSSERRGR